MGPQTLEARRRRLLRGGRWTAALGVVLLLLGLLFLPPTPVPQVVAYARASTGGGPGSGGTAPVTNLTLNLTDAPAFTPSYLTVVAPAELHLLLVNLGALNHTFTLVNRPNYVVNRSWTPTELDAYLRVNGSQANVSVAPGTNRSVFLNFSGEQAGFSYEFLSAIPYQFQAGMFGFLNLTGAPSGPGLVANVTTSATQLAFVPDAIGINASSFPVSVDMAISNLGSNSHTFTLAAQPNLTLDPGNFTAYFSAHPPLASVNVPTTPGQVVWANFTIKAAGVYEYICEIPGHFAAGMYGFLYVGVPVPAVAAPPSSAIVSVDVLYVGAGLFGVGVFLAVVALFVGRFPRIPGGGHGA